MEMVGPTMVNEMKIRIGRQVEAPRDEAKQAMLTYFKIK